MVRRQRTRHPGSRGTTWSRGAFRVPVRRRSHGRCDTLGLPSRSSRSVFRLDGRLRAAAASCEPSRTLRRLDSRDGQEHGRYFSSVEVETLDVDDLDRLALGLHSHDEKLTHGSRPTRSRRSTTSRRYTSVGSAPGATASRAISPVAEDGWTRASACHRVRGSGLCSAGYIQYGLAMIDYFEVGDVARAHTLGRRRRLHFAQW